MDKLHLQNVESHIIGNSEIDHFSYNADKILKAIEDIKKGYNRYYITHHNQVIAFENIGRSGARLFVKAKKNYIPERLERVQ